MNIGEEVVCVRAYDILVENQVYVVMNTTECRCGVRMIDVGLSLYEGISYCGECNEIKGCYREWYRADRFAPLSHLDFVLDEVHELLNPEVFQPCR